MNIEQIKEAYNRNIEEQDIIQLRIVEIQEEIEKLPMSNCGINFRSKQELNLQIKHHEIRKLQFAARQLDEMRNSRYTIAHFHINNTLS